jgi:hypothetical protein
MIGLGLSKVIYLKQLIATLFIGKTTDVRDCYMNLSEPICGIFGFEKKIIFLAICNVLGIHVSKGQSKKNETIYRFVNDYLIRCAIC